MAAKSTATTPPMPPFSETAVRLVLTRVCRTVNDLYRSADALCCTSPEAAAHLRQLAEALAADMLDSLKRWPT